MQVLLIGKNKIYKTNLSSEIIGEYWISDNIEMRDLIKIEAINGVWKAISNSYARIINPKYLKIEEELQIIKDEKTFVERASLKEYGMYIIALGSTKNLFILYCLPDKSNDFIHKKIVNTKEITIGNGENCSIVFENVLISELHSKIFFENSKWYVQNFDKRFGTMVNSLQIEDNITELENGDVIFIMGLKLVLINNNLFINNIENQINFKQNVLVQSKIKSRILDLNSFESDDDINLVNCDKYFSRSPRMKEIIEVEKIIIDPPPQSKNSEGKPILLMLGPSIAFGVVSFVTFFTVLYSIIKGNSSISNSITTLLFPFVTLISMLVIPILNFR